MGKAFTLHDLSFALNNLGIITFGSQGSQGSQGEQGNQGNQGNQGSQGSQGNQTPQYNFLDILYTDGNGNLSVSSEVLDTALGKTPIALCVAKTGFFGENEKARWIGLKWGNISYPNTGNYDYQTICFGPAVNVQEITDVSIVYSGASGNNANWGRFEYGSTNNNPTLVPNVYDENGDWNLSELGTVGTYALTNIDGKAHTAAFLEYVTETDWQTNSTIADSSSTGHWPAVEVAWRYSPNGTQQGDWYIGGVGEYALMENLRSDVNTKLTQIHAVYSGCISGISNEIWTSTERDNGQNYRMNVSVGQFGSKEKTEKKCVLPMLQY